MPSLMEVAAITSKKCLSLGIILAKMSLTGSILAPLGTKEDGTCEIGICGSPRVHPFLFSLDDSDRYSVSRTGDIMENIDGIYHGLNEFKGTPVLIDVGSLIEEIVESSIMSVVQKGRFVVGGTSFELTSLVPLESLVSIYHVNLGDSCFIHYTGILKKVSPCSGSHTCTKCFNLYTRVTSPISYEGSTSVDINVHNTTTDDQYMYYGKKCYCDIPTPHRNVKHGESCDNILICGSNEGYCTIRCDNSLTSDSCPSGRCMFISGSCREINPPSHAGTINGIDIISNDNELSVSHPLSVALITNTGDELSTESCLGDDIPCPSELSQYCPLTGMCVSSCQDHCSFLSVPVQCGLGTNSHRSECQFPTPKSCEGISNVYCHSNVKCVANCSQCVDAYGQELFQDRILNRCVPKWWNEGNSIVVPLVGSQSYCRFRAKVGMPCISDMDCPFGKRLCDTETRKCLGWGQDNSDISPAESTENDTLSNISYGECFNDLDCIHIGFYYGTIPNTTESGSTVAKNKCVPQKKSKEVCHKHVECFPGTLCNILEVPINKVEESYSSIDSYASGTVGLCTDLFSIIDSRMASHDYLCSSGYRNSMGICSTPPHSKNTGRACITDNECQLSGTSTQGRCVCKEWFTGGHPKYCSPVLGDYANNASSLRQWMSFKISHCGTHWTDNECAGISEEGMRRYKTYLCEGIELSVGSAEQSFDCNSYLDDVLRYTTCA